MENYYKNIDGYATMEDQGELFKVLTKDFKKGDSIKIAEIGVYKGRMTAMICDLMAGAGIYTEYHCVDHFHGSVEHEQKNYFPEFYMAIKPIINEENGIDIFTHSGDCVDIAKFEKDGYFDIVYIDASHDYLSVRQDIAAWLPKVKKGGVLCGDDYINGWDGVIQAVDEAFSGKVQRVGIQQWWVTV